jgi:hypothetical protein
MCKVDQGHLPHCFEKEKIGVFVFDLRGSSPIKKTRTTEVAGGRMVATVAPTDATTTPMAAAIAAPPKTEAARRPGPPSLTPGSSQSKCGRVQGDSDSSPSAPMR